jgi:phosphohistidine phosphatase SixA
MIVFVLRHADRMPDPADDLTPAGRERARLLARMLSQCGVSVAFHSDALRTLRTLEPLQQQLGGALTSKKVGSGQGVDQHVQSTVQAVKSLPTQAVAVVVGHSDTVVRIIEGLGGGSVGTIGANEFDKLFVLFIDAAGTATLLRLRYGAAT